MSKHLTSADIEDGKVEYNRETNARIEYKLIKGGYEVKTITPQANGTNKTQVRTFYDPTPVTAEEMANAAKNKKPHGHVERIDKNTTVEYRHIEGGHEEIYTTIHEDGSKSIKKKTLYDAVPVTDDGDDLKQQTQTSKRDTSSNTQKKVTQHQQAVVPSNQQRKVIKKVDSQEESTHEVRMKQEQTVEEHRRFSQTTEISAKSVTTRKGSLTEQNVKSITSQQTSTEKKDGKKKKPKGTPAPPPDFIENDSTTVVSNKVPGGTEYTFTTTLEDGRSVTTTKTIYEEEEVEMTEEEIQQYKKQLRDAEKHKNITKTTKLKSESGTKKIVPSENPGDVTTVETIKIPGGTEFHYTTVTSEGLVKKSTKTVYDAVAVEGNESGEEEIVEEYEEEIIEPGETTVKTIESTRTFEQRKESETIVSSSTKGKKKSKK